MPKKIPPKPADVPEDYTFCWEGGHWFPIAEAVLHTQSSRGYRNLCKDCAADRSAAQRGTLTPTLKQKDPYGAIYAMNTLRAKPWLMQKHFQWRVQEATKEFITNGDSDVFRHHLALLHNEREALFMNRKVPPHERGFSDEFWKLLFMMQNEKKKS